MTLHRLSLVISGYPSHILSIDNIWSSLTYIGFSYLVTFGHPAQIIFGYLWLLYINIVFDQIWSHYTEIGVVNSKHCTHTLALITSGHLTDIGLVIFGYPTQILALIKMFSLS